MTLPRVHAITDRQVFARADLSQRVRSLARHGAHLAVHVRDRTATARNLATHALQFAGWLEGSGVVLVVNARPDIARAVGAAGVQLGAHDLAPDDARIVFPGGLVGRSVHSVAEVAGARHQGADYAILGPVFPTATHPGATVLGPGQLPNMGIPVVAIGGITLERVRTVRSAGYYGVAAIRAIWDAADPGTAVAELLEVSRES